MMILICKCGENPDLLAGGIFTITALNHFKSQLRCQSMKFLVTDFKYLHLLVLFEFTLEFKGNRWSWNPTFHFKQYFLKMAWKVSLQYSCVTSGQPASNFNLGIWHECQFFENALADHTLTSQLQYGFQKSQLWADFGFIVKKFFSRQWLKMS